MNTKTEQQCMNIGCPFFGQPFLCASCQWAWTAYTAKKSMVHPDQHLTKEEEKYLAFNKAGQLIVKEEGY